MFWIVAASVLKGGKFCEARFLGHKMHTFNLGNFVRYEPVLYQVYSG